MVTLEIEGPAKTWVELVGRMKWSYFYANGKLQSQTFKGKMRPCFKFHVSLRDCIRYRVGPLPNINGNTTTISRVI